MKNTLKNKLTLCGITFQKYFFLIIIDHCYTIVISHVFFIYIESNKICFLKYFLFINI